LQRVKPFCQAPLLHLPALLTSGSVAAGGAIKGSAKPNLYSTLIRCIAFGGLYAFTDEQI